MEDGNFQESYEKAEKWTKIFVKTFFKKDVDIFVFYSMHLIEELSIQQITNKESNGRFNRRFLRQWNKLVKIR